MPTVIRAQCLSLSDGLSQGFPHAESNTPSGFDLDRLPGVGISAGAGLAVLHLECAEPGDRHASFFAQATLDSTQDRVHKTRGSEP
jgi:hypothetical protein